MIEFGKTLREAREARGFSVSQLAETTHILPQIIENLEREDFSKIVAPIYGRGFVKLYCETVGLDAKPLIDEFMAIYNGERPPVIRMKAPEAEVPPAIVPPAELPAAACEQPTASEPTPVTASVADEAPEPTPFPSEPIADEPPPVASRPLSRPLGEPKPSAREQDAFAGERPAPKRDYRLPGHAMPEVPRSIWRFGILIGALITILAALFFGCRALYRATMRTPAAPASAETTAPEPPSDAPAAQPDSAKAEPAQPAPRKPIAVPPLYID